MWYHIAYKLRWCFVHLYALANAVRHACLVRTYQRTCKPMDGDVWSPKSNQTFVMIRGSWNKMLILVWIALVLESIGFSKMTMVRSIPHTLWIEGLPNLLCTKPALSSLRTLQRSFLAAVRVTHGRFNDNIQGILLLLVWDEFLLLAFQRQLFFG